MLPRKTEFLRSGNIATKGAKDQRPSRKDVMANETDLRPLPITPCFTLHRYLPLYIIRRSPRSAVARPRSCRW